MPLLILCREILKQITKKWKVLKRDDRWSIDRYWQHWNNGYS